MANAGGMRLRMRKAAYIRIPNARFGERATAFDVNEKFYRRRIFVFQYYISSPQFSNTIGSGESERPQSRDPMHLHLYRQCLPFRESTNTQGHQLRPCYLHRHDTRIESRQDSAVDITVCARIYDSRTSLLQILSKYNGISTIQPTAKSISLHKFKFKIPSPIPIALVRRAHTKLTQLGVE